MCNAPIYRVAYAALRECAHRVWMLCNACGLIVLLASVVHAQDETVEPREEIVVTGQRLSQQRSIARKRASERIIDAVSADDIGRLPDKNAAEALDRLPGVSLTIDQGEGRFVAIRGLNSSLNNFTINGLSAGSPEAEGGGRRVPLDVIGSELLTAIEVVKVHSPDMAAQGIGGTINVITAGPFDHERGQHLLTSFQAGYDELSGKLPYAAELMISHLDESRTWGWSLGATYSFRHFETRGIYQDDWGLALAGDGSTTILPENTQNSLYDIERERIGVTGTLEWRPAEGSRYFLRGFLSQLKDEETRQRLEYFFRESLQSVTESKGTSVENQLEQDLRVEHKSKRFLNFAMGGETAIGRAWQLDYVAQFNDNRQQLPNRNWEWSGLTLGTDRWTVDRKGLVDVHAENSPDPAALSFLRLRQREHETQENAHSVGVDATRTIAQRDSYMRMGAKYTRTERVNDADEILHGPGVLGWTLGDFGHFDGNFVNSIDSEQRSNIRVNVAAAEAFADANSNDRNYFELQSDQTFEAQWQSDYEIEEEVLAGYLMANWDFGRGDLLAGVRVEHTALQSIGYQIDVDETSAARTIATGQYADVLPTVIVRFDLTNDLALRLAWGHTIGRPNYEQSAPSSFLERDGDDGLLQIGNPELEARRSTNYDLALEWYFARGGLFAVAAFRKDIDNEIVGRIRSFDEFTFNGELFNRFTIASTENADHSKVRGIELSYQQQFDFLPRPFNGLGVSFSYSRLDAESRVVGRDDTLPMARQPDWTRSGSLFYQKAGFELALALSEADSFLTEISDEPATDLYTRSYGRLDLRASYSFSEHCRAFFEWQNINNEPAIEYQGGLQTQTTQFETYGQTWYIGLTVRL